MKSKSTIEFLIYVISVMSMMISGCSSVQLTSKYDETIDHQTQQLQRKLDGHFVSMQNMKNEDLKYKNQQHFYEGVLSDLNALEVRASGIYDNQQTIEQLKLIKINFAYLILLNKECATSTLSAQQKERVISNGADLSMNCRVLNGAEEDIDNRGEIALNKMLISPIQKLFNQHLGAIMALEMEKKRGEHK